MGIVIVGPFDFLHKRRLSLLVISLYAIASTILNYEIDKKAKLAWIEPKRITRLRQKEEILSQIRQTSWSSIAFLMMLFVIPLQIIMPRWYYLPLIISACIIFIGFLLFIMTYFHRTTVRMDEKGIRLDSSLRKYRYGNIDSIELIPNSLGGYSLTWNYEGKGISRGISQEIEIAEIRGLIEKNSNLQLTINEALTSGSCTSKCSKNQCGG